ncbi:hypothetical protein BCR44DRAFT_74835 [Catenaria anguillulae PL171]|uniref:Uncharacterized protein n=1 Tax=Catenaria anguillulae PL171 TaxID=765915 RepID=A0A1Y2HPQ0_9FUNG|nr:hypothetical protein BCR44DRAFT_74835 [Catenaria anguillulae PL171]
MFQGQVLACPHLVECRPQQVPSAHLTMRLVCCKLGRHCQIDGRVHNSLHGPLPKRLYLVQHGAGYVLEGMLTTVTRISSIALLIVSFWHPMRLRYTRHHAVAEARRCGCRRDAHCLPPQVISVCFSAQRLVLLHPLDHIKCLDCMRDLAARLAPTATTAFKNRRITPLVRAATGDEKKHFRTALRGMRNAQAFAAALGRMDPGGRVCRLRAWRCGANEPRFFRACCRVCGCVGR